MSQLIYCVCFMLNFLANCLGVYSIMDCIAGKEMSLKCAGNGSMHDISYKVVHLHTFEDGPREILQYSLHSGRAQILKNPLLAWRVEFTPPKMKIKDLQVKGSGLYKCITRYETVEKAAWLQINVNAPPTNVFIVNTNATTIENGRYTAAICVAAKSMPEATISWTDDKATKRTPKSSETYTLDKKSGLFTTESALLLKLQKVTKDNTSLLRNKTYTCTVTHLTGVTKRKINVKLMYAPGPVTISVKLKENGGVSLKCKSLCVPECNFTWFQNEMFLSTGSRLDLTNVSKQHRAVYYCTAQNKLSHSSAHVKINISLKSLNSSTEVFSEKDTLESGLTWWNTLIAGTAVFVVLVVGIVIAIRLRRSRKLTYAINGRELAGSTQQTLVDVFNDDCVSDSSSPPHPAASPHAIDHQSSDEKQLQETAGSPMCEFPTEDPMTTKQNVEKFIVDVPTVKSAIQRGYVNNNFSCDEEYTTMRRRFATMDSRNQPLPICDTDGFSSPQHKENRMEFADLTPCYSGQSYPGPLRRCQSIEPTRQCVVDRLYQPHTISHTPAIAYAMQSRHGNDAMAGTYISGKIEV